MNKKLMIDYARKLMAGSIGEEGEFDMTQCQITFSPTHGEFVNRPTMSKPRN